MTLIKAKKIMELYGYKVLKLNENNYTTKANIFNEINKISTANTFIEKMLLCMYDRQEKDEKKIKNTTHKNFRGFNMADATVLSYLAEQFYETHKLTPAQYRLISSLLKKYHRQIFEILIELGIIKVKGRLYYFDNVAYNASEIGVKAQETAEDLLNVIKIYTLDEFVKEVIKQAEEDGGDISEDEMKYAKQIASDKYASGATITDAADAINYEI